MNKHIKENNNIKIINKNIKMNKNNKIIYKNNNKIFLKIIMYNVMINMFLYQNQNK